MGRVTVHWGEAGLTCMRNGDYDGAMIEEDLALPIAGALPPPFFYGWLRTVRFQRPLGFPINNQQRNNDCVLISIVCSKLGVV